MFATTPPIPPALLALLASFRGQQQHPFLGGQLPERGPTPFLGGGQPQDQTPSPFLGNLAGLVEQRNTDAAPMSGPFRDVVEQMSPLVAAAASGHGAQLPENGRIPDAVPANPYGTPAQLQPAQPLAQLPGLPAQTQPAGGRQLPDGMYAHGGGGGGHHRPGPGLHPGHDHRPSQGGFMGPSQVPPALEQLIARLRQQRPNVRYE